MSASCGNLSRLMVGGGRFATTGNCGSSITKANDIANLLHRSIESAVESGHIIDGTRPTI
jgi:hypothetical protein